MTLAVEAVDPLDRAAFDEWYAVIDASCRRLWPDRPGWQPDELRGPAVDPDGAERVVLLGARDDGRMVGAALVELPQHDNLHLGRVDVEVDPDHLRRGAGRALLAASERVAAEDGRHVVYGWDERRIGSDGSGAASFAEAAGYAMVLEELRRELSVPIDATRAAELATAAPRAARYEIVTFSSWPEQWLGDRAELGRHMSTDPPFGGLAFGEERWGPARVRQHERRIEAMGRQVTVAAAVERASGRAVAFSDLTVSRSSPEFAYQWDTLVLAAHRGHRLGLSVKLANLARLAEISPLTTRVVTWNATANQAMIAVNETLGARVASVRRTWQKRL